MRDDSKILSYNKDVNFEMSLKYFEMTKTMYFSLRFIFNKFSKKKKASLKNQSQTVL